MHSQQDTLSLPDETQATLVLALLRTMREQAQSTSAGAIEYGSWQNAGALEYDSWRNAL